MQQIIQPLVTNLQPAVNQYFECIKNKWNTNQEISDILYAAQADPQSQCIASHVWVKANSGTQLIFPRYDGSWFKNDEFIWRRRREGKLVREDHMKLKIHKQQVISANYVHSAICPTFHRRVYWLTHSPAYVLVHYLNESNADKGIRKTAEIIAECMQANNVHQLTHQQLLEQLVPIYAHCLKADEVQVLTNTVLEIIGSSQSPRHFQLERRNSCSSAFRRGLSSMALRRQPSANSEIDANYIGSMMKKYGCTPPTPQNATILSNTPSPPVAPCTTCGPTTSAMTSSRSPSGDTEHRSSTLDEVSMRSSSTTKSPIIITSATKLPPIIEISPSAAKPGDTVLIIGAWYLKGHTYQVTFGAARVSARLLQAGVLSTVVPQQSGPGIMSTVPLRVYCNNQAVSTSKDFGYLPTVVATRDDNSGGGGTVEAPESVLYQILEKIRIISYALGVYPVWEQISSNIVCTEEALVSLVQQIQKSLPTIPPTQIHHNLLGDQNLPTKTILHLIAQLDFVHLFESLIHLSQTLSTYYREFDIVSRDHEGSTPLHQATRHNATKVAKLIMSINATAIDVLDDRGRTPADVLLTPAILVDDDDDVEPVNATELWVLTNGETVTREHLLLSKLSQTRVAASTSSANNSSNSSDGDSQQQPLHVEISMDTDVHVPDSPKMAKLFQMVTSPGVQVTDTERAKMADLARQIIDALPARIKASDPATTSSSVFFDRDEVEEVDDENARHMSTQHNPMLSSSGNSMDSSCHQFYDMMVVDQQSDTSRFTSSFDKGSFSESETLDFDKDLGEFFTIHLDAGIDPIQQRLANLKFNDDEQRDVYEAAMVIQRAYREYRARNVSRRQEDIERSAALKIQSCYRRYKQFCYFKKLHNAAIVVQKHFRMRKKDDKDEGGAHEDIASNVPEHPTLDGQSIRIQVPQTNSSLLREHRAATTIQLAYRGHRKRQAAARKIQNFMRQSRNKLRKMHAQNDDAMSAPTPTPPSPPPKTTINQQQQPPQQTMSLENPPPPHPMCHGCTTQKHPIPQTTPTPTPIQYTNNNNNNGTN